MYKDRGNALFLILIAVALFAALSYAVTQSGRGGRSVDRENALIAGAQIVQYAAQVRTAVQRMVLTGTAASSLVFCSTGDTDGHCRSNGTTGEVALCDSGTDCVFAAEGGGVPVLELPDAAIFTVVGNSTYHFFEDGAASTINFLGVGTTTEEIFMTAGHPNQGGPVLTEDVCEAINEGLGLASTIVEEDWTDGIDSHSGEAGMCIDPNPGGGFATLAYFQALVER